MTCRKVSEDRVLAESLYSEVRVLFYESRDSAAEAMLDEEEDRFAAGCSLKEKIQIQNHEDTASTESHGETQMQERQMQNTCPQLDTEEHS